MLLFHHSVPSSLQLQLKAWYTVTYYSIQETNYFVLDKMSSITHRQTPFGLGNLRNAVTWLFITTLIAYFIYSLNVIFNKDPKCSLPSSNISNKQRLETTLLPARNSSWPACKKYHEGSEKCLPPPGQRRFDTKVKHIVFGLASTSNFWNNRKEYIKLWWRPGETRGVVWLDQNVTHTPDEALPEVRISGDTDIFPYTNVEGDRSALRISRVVSETLRLGMKDVRWFVMGDDDTVFIADNLARMLSKYDHNQFYYIGSISESHIQDLHFSFAMAYGGGGFAVSYPLAKELSVMQDKCMHRYPGLYGSDDRLQACMAELGVPLTKETGFHQFDFFGGSVLGFLGAHPITPLLSVHHLDVVEPLFPDLNRVESIRRLLESAKHDSASLVQQSICYDTERSWSISVSWGYAVQIIWGYMAPRELEVPARTFLNWYPTANFTGFSFNTRFVSNHPCQKPYVYYMNTTRYDRSRNQVTGVYKLHIEPHPDCDWKGEAPDVIDSVVVTKKPDPNRWWKSPRRDCCRVTESKKTGLHIWVKNCDDGELSAWLPRLTGD